VRLKKALSLLVVVGVVAACTPSENTASGSGSGNPLTIAVIPKGTSHAFWKSVEAGAKQAGTDLGANILWKGPLKEDDRASQISIVQQFTADRVSAIVLAPLDDQALVAPVQAASSKNIPVVVIDSGLKGDAGKDFVSFVATDNRKAGELGGERLAKLLGEKGKVILMRYSEGSASTAEREAGFLSAIGKYPNIEVISDNVYAGATQAEAQTKAMQMIDTFRQADGLFTPNESSTLGVLQALSKNGLIGKMKFVGFDATPLLVEALQKGEVDALVAQNPMKMGYEGVRVAIDKLKGNEVQTNVDTGTLLIDGENLQSEEVQKLLAGK
jgi:ribose transport system substrate-binding protein